MILQSISLENFRNFKKQTFTFEEATTLILGDNSKGKTNVLESIFFICMGKGIKNEKQEEIIAFDENQTTISAEFNDRGGLAKFRICIEKGIGLKKTYLINNSKKILGQYLKLAPPAVLFSPELMNVISGQPAERRSYIDMILERIDIEYKKRLQNYQSGIRRRNKVLEKEVNREKLKEVLPFWNTYLIEQAIYIQEKRKWVCSVLNKNPSLSGHYFSIEYIQNEMSEERFSDYADKEYYQKRTLIGPQRDDYFLYKKSPEEMQGVNVHKYCSRGEQRLALFWLIFNHIQILHTELRIKPIVLLDDILSELDEANKKVIFEQIKGYQTIISTTEEDVVRGKGKKGIINL